MDRAFLLPGLLLALLGLAAVIALALRRALIADRELNAERVALRERLQARDDELVSLQARQSALQRQHDALSELHADLRAEHSGLQTLLDEERKQSRERLALLQDAREQMRLEFRHLANEILEQKGKAFTELNQRGLHELLKPLGEKLQGFERKVEESYGREARERFSLAREIRNLMELNSRLSSDADNLTRALKGESKTQGIWGEVVLERVLEQSGLTRGREYELQVALKSEEGRLRQPDVIVHLPENRDIVIDAKVSLKAYEQFVSETDDERRAACLKQHILSIRGHIKALSAKDYHKLESLRSLDYVLLFLPVEGAFTLAIQQDQNLFTEAFEKNIILVGPSTLLATLRTIQNIWSVEIQNRNALEIATRAGALYDKFHGFCEDLEAIGSRLMQAQAAFEDARGKLSVGRGNLLGQVEKLKLLGARASKQLPYSQLDEELDDDLAAAPPPASSPTQSPV